MACVLPICVDLLMAQGARLRTSISFPPALRGWGGIYGFCRAQRNPGSHAERKNAQEYQCNPLTTIEFHFQHAVFLRFGYFALIGLPDLVFFHYIILGFL